MLAESSQDEKPSTPTAKIPIAYKTDLGSMHQGTAEEFLRDFGNEYAGKAQLVFFSPPFPLKRKKKYGNLVGNEYLEWLAALAPRFADLLTDDGSLVVEVGNAWNPGKPTMSLLPLRALMAIADADPKLDVCQQFICHNPARLPSPVQWVNIERIRVKDSYTHVWWYSRNEKPKTNQRAILKEYSPAMKALLRRQTYNHGPRGSEHVVGEKSFLTDHGGAIPPSVFLFSNTRSGDAYRKYVRAQGLKPHPAPMQADLAEWFIKFLTDSGDLVIDPFGGSNTTGAAAETLGRRWVSIEPDSDYVAGSRGRFDLATLRDPDLA